MLIKTVILLECISFDLIKLANLSTTFLIRRFLTFVYFFHKNVLLAFFNLGVNVIYIYILK